MFNKWKILDNVPHSVLFQIKSIQICELSCDIRVFCYSAPNEECGEIPVAFVVRRQETALSEQDVINYVAAQVRLSASKGVLTYWKRNMFSTCGDRGTNVMFFVFCLNRLRRTGR